MPLRDKLPLGFALLLWATAGVCQSNLGELLDAGAKRLSAEEFRQHVVEQTLRGPTVSGRGSMDIIYTTKGLLQGMGTPPYYAAPTTTSIDGEWTFGDNGSVCTTIVVRIPVGAAIVFPRRCQVWFKLDDRYYFSDSDTDRRARVLSYAVVK